MHVHRPGYQRDPSPSSPCSINPRNATRIIGVHHRHKYGWVHSTHGLPGTGGSWGDAGATSPEVPQISEVTENTGPATVESWCPSAIATGLTAR